MYNINFYSACQPERECDVKQRGSAALPGKFPWTPLGTCRQPWGYWSHPGRITRPVFVCFVLRDNSKLKEKTENYVKRKRFSEDFLTLASGVEKYEKLG